MPSEKTAEDFAIFPSMSAPEIIKSTPKPPFPIRVSDQGPQPFDLKSQERVMRWKHLNAFEWFPVWEIELVIELIKDVAREYLDACGFDSDAITVETFARGTHNKLYTINTKYAQTGLPAQCLFRAAMPIYPWYKVESDIATAEFVRHFTSIPVPVIYAYDSSTNNKLGLEWMLMEKVSGFPLEEKWTDMSLKTQTKLTTSVADWANQLSGFVFDKLGNLYMRYTETTLDFYIGPMVEQHFYDGRRLTYTIDRGPFPSLQAYYDAILHAQQQEVEDARYLAEYQRLFRATEYEDVDDQTRYLLKAKLASQRDAAYESDEERESGAENITTTDNPEHAAICDNAEIVNDKALEPRGLDDVSDIFVGKVLFFKENMLADLPRALEALRNALSSLVEEPGEDMFSTMLMHHDISTDNILVGHQGEVKALVDWEMVCLHPAILKTQIPHFLQSYDNFGTPTIELLEQDGEAFFFRECKSFILTKLRKVFRDRLEELESRYLLIFEDPSGLHKALYERVFERANHYGGHVVDWVEVQLAPTDDEDESESEGEDEEEEEDDEEEEEKEEKEVVSVGLDSEGHHNERACEVPGAEGFDNPPLFSEQH